MDKLYTIQEVADKLGLSDKTLRRWEEAGRFASSRTLGNQRRYSLEDLQILDALKHGTFDSQRDLLTLEQAARTAGVSPTSILRWENEGKIHPFITAGNTYYPRTKLVEKMDELKREYPEVIQPRISREPAPVRPIPPAPDMGTVPNRNPRLQVEEGSSADEGTVPQGFHQKLSPLPVHSSQPLTTQRSAPNFGFAALNALVTIIILIAYHLLFISPNSKPISPSTGSVQGAVAPDPRLDLLERYISKNGNFTPSSFSLTPSFAPKNPSPGTIYLDADTNMLKIYRNGSWSDLGNLMN